MVKNQR